MIDPAVTRLAERNMTRHRILTQAASALPAPARPAVAPPAPDRHVIAVAGPRAGQHGTALSSELRRCGPLTLPVADPPWLVPAGCQVTWDDGTASGYQVAQLRCEPCTEPQS